MIKTKIATLTIYTFLAVIALVMLYPFWHELMISFSSNEEVFKGGVFLYPKGGPIFAAYKNVLMSKDVFVGYRNTIFITVIGTIFNVIFTITTAYPLSRNTLPGRRLLMFFIVVTMLFNGGMIPTYLVVNAVGLVDSLWALIIPTLITAYNVIIMKTFFENLPKELFEAATIDGAGKITVLLKIVLPLSMPVIAVIILWRAVGHWNAYIPAMIYLTSRANITLQLVMRNILFASDANETIISTLNGYTPAPDVIRGATIIVSTLPIMLIYPFLQKYFTKGIMLGAVKG